MDEIILNERKFKEELVQLINSSNLHALILKPIFKELLEQIQIQEQIEYEQAKRNKAKIIEV